MGDDGLAVGNALAFLLHRDGLTTWLSRRRRLDGVYLGRDHDGVIDKCLGSATGVKRHGGDPAVLATDFEITPVNRYAAIF
jgi:carbamoyltransferase